jgi:hypothetical protein
VVDLLGPVAARDVAVAAQPEVAIVVGVGLMRPRVLAAVELDDDAPVAPEAVDDVRAERLVASGQLDAVADQQRSEAPLEGALRLAVTGRVGIEGGSEVGTARVAAAERADDVVGTDVVLELGLGEGLEERRLAVAGGEIEQGACDRGAAEAPVPRDVARADRTAVSRCADLYRDRRGRDDPSRLCAVSPAGAASRSRCCGRAAPPA